LDLSLNITPLLSTFLIIVCKDSSCGKEACVLARIPYVVDSSCTDEYSCRFAQIGSVDSSCKDRYSCINAQLSGVTLINSCNKDFSCQNTIGDEAFEELIGCCNESRQQCEFQDGLDIVDVGCVSCCLLYLLLI